MCSPRSSKGTGHCRRGDEEVTQARAANERGRLPVGDARGFSAAVEVLPLGRIFGERDDDAMNMEQSA